LNDNDDYGNLDRIDMTVQELLTEMKDISEVIVDLAYASLMYNSQDMAVKVHELEGDMDDLKYAIRVKLLLAARTKDDAKQLAGILQVASAADRICEAAGEIVKLLSVPVEKRPFITTMLNESEEKIRTTKIASGSDMVGHTIDQLAVEACTGMKIIAVRNRHGWIYDPEDDLKLRAGDDIIVRGTDDGFEFLKQFTSGKREWEFPETDEEEDFE
jgi:uncharacterized protein with PhoU and TrkA domain